MDARETKALEVLKAGGFFRYALETCYHRPGEQFRMRLFTADRQVVPGIGHAAQRSLEKMGALSSRECASSSTWPEEWEIAQRIWSK